MISIQVTHGECKLPLTSSIEQAFKSIKALGVKGLDQKKEPRKWLKGTTTEYRGFKEVVSVVVR